MSAARLTGAFAALGLVCLALTAAAQSPPEEESPLARLGWVPGPATGELGQMAQVEVPEGFLYLDGKDTRTFLKTIGNVPDGSEQGMLLNAEKQWFVVFDFAAEGYVRDDDKDDIDADEILDAMKEGTVASNERRRTLGLNTLTLLGWAKPPHYDAETNLLEWAITLKDDTDGGESINHQARLLGRRGIMNATLVCDPSEFEGALGTYHGILGKYEFKDGHRYAQYVSGDKVAEYGLTGLMLGGAAVIGAKSGFFKAIWKFLVFGVLAIGAFVKRLFGRGEA
ncbi:MAG: DUF2167 domain-containing protein [bacterium]